MRQSDAIRQIIASGMIKPGQYWSQLLDFPKYLIGDHGAVISLVSKPKILVPIKRGKYDGYTLVDQTGKLRAVYRHRLVAELIYGPCPDGTECCHNDDDKGNCDFTNIRWDTHLANVQDKVRLGTSPKGERNPMAKLTRELVEQMRDYRRRSAAPYKEIAKIFNVSTMTAYRAIVGQSWN